MRRVAAGAAVVLFLAGCGGAAHRTAAPPPVKAVHEALPDYVRTQLDSMLGLDVTKGADLSGSFMCVVSVTSTKVGKCSAAELAAGRATQLRYQAALAPAPGREPRAVAALRLPYGFRELLIAWRSKAGLLCMSAARVSVGTVDAPFGPCVVAGERAAGYPENPLSPGVAPSVSPRDRQRRRTQRLLPGGHRAAGRDGAARDGRRRRRDHVSAARAAPPGTGSRVFMTKLGARGWRRVELVRGKTVVATEAMVPKMAAFADCEDKYAGDRAKRQCLLRAKARARP